MTELLSLDLRSLAIYRVGLSLVLLYDLLDRSRNLIAHYSDLGVVPAEEAVAVFGRRLVLGALPPVLAVLCS